MKNAARAHSGFSLIELMIAMVLGLLVAAGIVSVFQSTSSSNRAQRQLAVLQEEGRYAINRIKDDLLLANSQFCSNTGGNAGATAAGVALDALRSPTVDAKVTGGNALNGLKDLTLIGTTNKLPIATTPFSIPSAIFMRGYDCGKTSASCKPTDPSGAANSPLPPMGKAVGNRVVGSSVLTLRYLDPTRGWSITPTSTTVTPTGAGGAAVGTITLKPVSPPEPPATDFQANDLALVTDCSQGQIFSVTVGGGGVLTPNNAANFTPPSMPDTTQPAKVFDFNRDFNTITYYLKVVDNGNGGTTGALIRRVNGDDTNGELVRGIERLDFRYGIVNANGETEFLSANQVDSATDADGAIPCPPGVSLVGGMPTNGCLWRAVQSIQVNLLMDGQTPLYTLAPREMAYAYTPDGAFAPVSASSHAIQPSDQGFPNQLLRREFSILVSLRNFNP